MPDSATNERLARLEARFDSLQTHLDDSHGRLENEIREQRITMSVELKDQKTAVSEQLREIRGIFQEYVAKDTEGARKTEITVAQHDWMLKGVGGVLIAFLVAATPVLLEHYLSPSSDAPRSNDVSTTTREFLARPNQGA